MAVRDLLTGRWRRGVLMAGVVGTAVVLGGGSYLLTDHLTRGDNVTTGAGPVEVSVAPSVASASPAASSPAAQSASPSAVPTAAAQAVPTTSEADEAKTKKEIQAARDAAERDGVPLRRARTPKSAPVADAVTRTEDIAGGTIRITTARGDLSGQSDQLIAADDGEPVGTARCTRNLRFNNVDKVKQIPTVLLCWRTSAERSVVTLAAADSGKPSSAASVKVIEREWAKLG
ncbi:hypothetical protein ACQPZX_37775 [Actinoplanes sp. CA-142083]|uniref:hypothetical protein n=1 Tax=Actinoplanes sp. CA-142083 TaxID=3239903 RepID=UPI003D93FA9C